MQQTRTCLARSVSRSSLRCVTCCRVCLVRYKLRQVFQTAVVCECEDPAQQSSHSVREEEVPSYMYNEGRKRHKEQALSLGGRP
jgi:hypothetical protein